MLIDVDKLLWPELVKGGCVWTTTPPDCQEITPDSPVYWARVTVEKDFGFELGPEEYLIETELIRRPGESDEEYDARVRTRAVPSRSYRPGRIQNLYETFAFTEPTKDQILDFAETYGMLGLQQHYKTLIYEPFSLWVKEILSIRRAYRLWTAIKCEDEQALSAISKEKKNSPTNWPPGTVEWAWDEIAWASNTALYCYNFEPNIRLIPDATGLELGFRPYSLIGLIWQQFAMVVTIRDRWTVCQYCGEPFEAKRKGRMYCSDSHRQMAYQKRREAHE